MNLSPRRSNALAHSSSDTIKLIGGTEDKQASHQVRWDFEPMHNTGADTGGPASGDLISEALSQLPVDDRAKAFDEIHGVQGPSGASRQFVESKILALQHQLRLRIQHGHDSPTRAFSLAAMQNSEFAYHPVVCERFLFASDFDVFEAASAIFRYYDLKYQLWGEKKLTGEVELDDLMETDIEILKMGCFQVLPERDRAGRQIGTIVLKNQKFPSMQCAARVLWYTFQMRVDQPSEFMIVWLIFYIIDPSSKLIDASLLQMCQQLLSTFPWKKAACHHCVVDDTLPQFKSVLGQLLSPLDSANRAKTKVHSGTFNDWIKSLMTYGIPPHIIPINDDGRIRVKNHMEFLKGRKTAELLSRAGERNVVFLPLNSDILFGRGKPIQQTPGNLRLSAIVDSFVTEYHTRNKQDKTALATQIVDMVKSASGRFLSKNAGIWTIVSDDIAREKVSGLFRTLYRKRFDGDDTMCIDPTESNEVVSRMA